MKKYSKYNIVYRLQKWMDSVPGQTFLNYVYSWGASIVILGALFKLTHLAGGNIMLYIGMGTEVFVFFLSAFDRPFDKTADGREIPTHLTEEYLESGKVTYQQEEMREERAKCQFQYVPHVKDEEYTQQRVMQSTIQNEQPQWVTAQQENAPELIEAQSNYVTELTKLTETLGKVSEQSIRLTRDSEEMENLNRTLTGICKVYEMQLKGASKQIGTIDQINEQTVKMARQIEQLNEIYTRMIKAMTVNMQAANAQH